jgi:hypothetical protein
MIALPHSTVENRWDEKADLRWYAVPFQVIDALEANVEEPEKSPVFSKESGVPQEHHVCNSVCDSLVLGQAELGLGHNQEGIQALNVFLEQSRKHPLAGQVRTLISEINERKSSHTGADNAASENPPDVDALAALDAPALPTKPWAPPDVDEVNPPLASGAECPANQVIAEAGKRVQELVDDLSRFAAVEDLLHQPLDAYGVPLRTDTRKMTTWLRFRLARTGW